MSDGFVRRGLSWGKYVDACFARKALRLGRFVAYIPNLKLIASFGA